MKKKIMSPFVTRWIPQVAALALIGTALSANAKVIVGFEANEGFSAQTFTQQTNLNSWRFAVNNKISTTRSHSGTQSLEIAATSAAAIYTLPTVEDYVEFSWSFYTAGTRVNNARASHAYLFVGNDEVASLGAIQFRTYYGPNPTAANRLYYTTWNAGGTANADNYVEVAGLNLAAWNTLTFTLNTAQHTYSLSLNGAPVAGIQNIALSTTWSNPSHLSQIYLSNPTNNLVTFYDDVIFATAAAAVPEPGALSLWMGAIMLGGGSLVLKGRRWGRKGGSPSLQ